MFHDALGSIVESRRYDHEMQADSAPKSQQRLVCATPRRCLEEDVVSHDRDQAPSAQTMRITRDMVETLARKPQRRFLLFVFQHDGARSIPLSADSSIIVGRDIDADLRITDQSLSRRHARFSIVGDEVIVEDLRSMNGTHVRGAPIERATIALGEEVWLGSIVAFVHYVGAGTQGSRVHSVSQGIETHDTFIDALAAEITRAGFFGRTAALLTIRTLDRDGGSALRQLCVRLREDLRAVDRLAVYSTDSIEILLPEMDVNHATKFCQTVLRKCPDEPLFLCGIATYTGAFDTADKLIEASRRAAREASVSDPVRSAAQQNANIWQTANLGLSEGNKTANSNDLRQIAKSQAMTIVLEMAQRLARSIIPVLLLGETGVGKEVLARYIHETSHRKDKPILCVNCAAIPVHLVESTLFGHEKGAFTGAAQQHKGVFEAADGGTVLLDELGELPAAAQAALLRVLETKRVCRVGSTREIQVNVRLIAATHRDLEAMVEAGLFRADLLYRLNTMTLYIPPLRARRDDIEDFAMRFLDLANDVNETKVVRIEPAAMSKLKAYDWPGNVRELRNAIERAAVIAEGDAIRVIDLPERVRGSLLDASPESVPEGIPIDFHRDEPLASSDEGDMPSPSDRGTGTLRERIDRYEADLVFRALQTAGWNQSVAARALGLPRRTLQHKIKAHGIQRLGYAIIGGTKSSR
jgi:transcriptional regulator with GAF, ATPase, and Fis domain